MRTLSIFLLGLLLLASASVQAQSANDMVILKDGSIIKGTVTESIVGSHVRIVTVEGVAHQYPMDQVDRVKMLGVKEAATFKKIGYFNSTGIGVMIGSGLYGQGQVSPSLRTVNGVQLGKRWQLGLGTGLEYTNARPQVPLFAEGRYHILQGEVSPFVGVQAGWQVPLSNPNQYYYSYVDETKYKSPGGVLLGAEVGIRNVVKRHFGYSVSLGYRMQQDKQEVPLYFWNQNETQYTTAIQRTTMQRLCLSFAFLFN